MGDVYIMAICAAGGKDEDAAAPACTGIGRAGGLCTGVCDCPASCEGGYNRSVTEMLNERPLRMIRTFRTVDPALVDKSEANSDCNAVFFWRGGCPTGFDLGAALPPPFFVPVLEL